MYIMTSEPDPNLFFATPGPFLINAAQPVDCPLGQIVYAGTKWNSQATYGHAKPPDFFRPTSHFLLVLTLEGEADYVDRTGVRAVLRPGDLVWAAPGVEQSYGPRAGSRWSELYLWLSGPLFDTWHAQGFPGARTRLLHLAPLGFWVERLVALVQPVGVRDTHLLRLCGLQSLLAEALARHGDAAQPPQQRAWLEAACRRLAAGTMLTPSLTVLARQAGVSYSLFRKQFTAQTGKTPGQFRVAALIQRACQTLASSAQPIHDIADELGFHDQFHFSRRFKAVVGMSPREFRRQHGADQAAPVAS